MSEFDVLIIGGGVAGLTCGCLLAKRGLRVLIVEKNRKVGGCCSSFEKDGFSFDLSVQSLGECQEGGRIWNVLKALDLLDGIRFLPLEPARMYHFPTMQIPQSSRLETHLEHLSRLFYEERRGIEQVYEVLKKVYEEFSRLPPSVNWFDPSSFSARFPFLAAYKDRTFGQLLLEYIDNPFLRTILSVRCSYALLPPEEISVVAMAGIEMSYFRHGVSCVEGKVEELPLKLAMAFEREKGKILSGQLVQRILFKERKAVGVRLENGEILTGKAIVSNIDAHRTFTELIGEDFLPRAYRAKLGGLRPSLSYFILYLGIEGDLKEIPVSNNEIFSEDPPSKEYEALYEGRIPERSAFYLLAPSRVNPSHAPPGKSTLCLSLKAPYLLNGGWTPETIDRLSEGLISKAKLLLPDLEKRILVKAVATPKTIEQWTGNHMGAAYGWAQIPSQSGIYRLSRSTPISNLFLTGHWTSPGGGIAAVVASGELTAQTLWSRFERGEF
ncbi:MAG: NAD(P)/FAD-dependent oxidoreductase [Desulfobacterota bacterium]|nr:NAD(P)/FAD-dependent oxidoreductase [Thermodesulfobacteriota bacterium]